MRSPLLSPLFFLTLVLIGGCNSRPESAVVKGKVTLDGEPLASAQLQLIPKDDPNLAAHATTSATDGTFVFQPDSSAARPVLPGKYKVLVSKPGSAKGAGEPSMATVNLVPPLYSDRAKTPLIIDVGSGVTQLEPFNLTKTSK